MSEVNLTQENFDKETSQGVVLVDFWAEWCGPCKMLAPVLEELAEEYKDKGLTVGKVNIEQNEALANKFQIMNIPTMLLFKDGEVVAQMTGFLPKEELQKKIDPVL